MMQGLALDRSAPLYGRAQELFRLLPLRPGWIGEALGLDGTAADLEAVTTATRHFLDPVLAGQAGTRDPIGWEWR